MSKVAAAPIAAMIPALVVGTIVLEGAALEHAACLYIVRCTQPSAERFPPGADVSLRAAKMLNDAERESLAKHAVQRGRVGGLSA